MSFLSALVCLLGTVSLGGFNNYTPNETVPDSIVKYPVIHSVSVTTAISYVASSPSDDIRETISKDEIPSVNSAVPVHLKYSFSFTDPKIRNYLPGGYQGIGFSILNLGALQPHGCSTAIKNIGYPVSAYIFQGGPVFHFRHGLSVNYEWNFGAAFGWKPSSVSMETFNLTVGSRVNAYLNLNFCLLWQFNSHTGFFGGLTVSHFSNGNTSFPNPGVNSFGLKLGMVWTLNPSQEKYPAIIHDPIKKKRLQYDIMAWGATRKRVYRGGENPVLLPGHFACAGISFAPMVRINPWWRAGGSLDIQWDRSSDMKKNYIDGSTSEDIKFTTPSFWRQISTGISAHGELRMPIFSVNVGLGYNIITPVENRGTYQNIALKTYLGENFFVNVGYQLRNFHQQSSLMLGAGVTI